MRMRRGWGERHGSVRRTAAGARALLNWFALHDLSIAEFGLRALLELGSTLIGLSALLSSVALLNWCVALLNSSAAAAQWSATVLCYCCVAAAVVVGAVGCALLLELGGTLINLTAVLSLIVLLSLSAALLNLSVAPAQWSATVFCYC